jgi:uncharacterized membrane protein YdjX (TVP38/TMEM64 family)
MFPYGRGHRSRRRDPEAKLVNRRLINAAVTGGVAAPILLYLLHGGVRDATNAAVVLAVRADIAPLRDYLLGFGWWAPVVSTLLQILTSVFAPLPSFMLALVNAMLFGPWWGAALTWASAMLAAAICFAISRVYGRPVVRRFVPLRMIDSTDRFFVRHGVLAVFIARIIPFINPDIVSYAAGLTTMRWRLFMLSIGAGAIPSTAIYSFLGARGITSVGWLLVPLVVVGILAMTGLLLKRSAGEPALSRIPAAAGDD